MKFSTLLLSLGVGCGLVAARGFSLARENIFSQGSPGESPITTRTEIPHGGYPIYPAQTRSHRRGLGPSVMGTAADGEHISSNVSSRSFEFYLLHFFPVSLQWKNNNPHHSKY